MTLLYQNAYYVVNNLNVILYGVEIVLYFQTIQQLLSNRTRTFVDKVLIVVSTVQLILITIYWTTQAYFGQMMWIIHADYPGGMDAYFSDHVSVWYQTCGTAAVLACNLLGDVVLTYRLFIIWDSRGVVVLPALLWLASFAFGIGLLYESGRPNGNYYAGIANTFGTCWGYTTFAFNVIVTSLICGRIIWVTRSAPYSAEDRRLFTTGPVAIMVESAFPYTAFSLVLSSRMRSGATLLSRSHFTPCSRHAISPQLITLRVLSRRAWARDDRLRNPVTTIGFDHPDRSYQYSSRVDTIRDMEESVPGGDESLTSVVTRLSVLPSKSAI